MTTAPSPKALSLAMAMIDRRAWRLPGQIVELVRALTIDDPLFPSDELVLLGHKTVATWFEPDARGHRYVFRVMRELVADRVLLMEPGAGRRPAAYGVNGALHQWRNVPWLVPRELALLRVQTACAPPIAAQRNGSAAIHLAALGDLAPRSISRHKNDVAPRYGSRHNGSACAATGIAAQSPEAAGPVLSSEVENYFPQERAKELIAAVVARSGGNRCWGRPRAELEQLVRDHGIDECLRALDKVPAGLGVPMAVEHLSDVLAGAAAATPVGPTPADLERRAVTLRRLIATAEADGDQALAEQLREELETLS